MDWRVGVEERMVEGNAREERYVDVVRYASHVKALPQSSFTAETAL